MSHKTTTVLVALRDNPHAIGRLIARCHARGWAPVAMRTVSDGARCEVTMRLRVPDDRRGTEAQLQAQIERLVDVEHVAVDAAEGRLPDDVAFEAVHRKASWIAVASHA